MNNEQINNKDRDLSYEKYVTVSNKWTLSKGKTKNLIQKYGNNALSLYCLSKQCRNHKGIHKITQHDFEEWFGANRKRDKMKLFKVMNHFVKEDFIVTSKNYNFDQLVKENIYITFSEIQGGFFKLYYYELDAIFDTDQNIINKHSLLSILACIKTNYDEFNKKYCFPSIREMSVRARLSQRTVIDGVNLLRDMGLILYDNPGTRVLLNGDIKESNNIYTMNYKGNHKILKDYIEKKRYEVDIEYKRQQNKQLSNSKRSIKMKLNNLDSKLDRGDITIEQYNNNKLNLDEQYTLLLNEQKDKWSVNN